MIEFFSFKGRIRRSEYAKSLVITVVLFIAWVWLKGVKNQMIFNAISHSSSYDASSAMVLHFLAGALLIAIFWFFLAQSAKRLHDIGLSGWFDLVLLVPPILSMSIDWKPLSDPILLATLILPLILSFIDGKPYENKYGPDPKGRDEKNA